MIAAIDLSRSEGISQIVNATAEMAIPVPIAVPVLRATTRRRTATHAQTATKTTPTATERAPTNWIVAIIPTRTLLVISTLAADVLAETFGPAQIVASVPFNMTPRAIAIAAQPATSTFRNATVFAQIKQIALVTRLTSLASRQDVIAPVGTSGRGLSATAVLLFLTVSKTVECAPSGCWDWRGSSLTPTALR
jgi:hypothetical protein